MKCFKSTDQQKSVDIFFSQLFRYFFEFSGRKGSLRSKVGSAGVNPTGDGFPGEAVDVSFDEPLHAVVNAVRVVAFENAVPDERTDG